MIKNISVLFCDRCAKEIETVIDCPHLKNQTFNKDYACFICSEIDKGSAEKTKLLVFKYREDGYTYYELKMFCSNKCEKEWCNDAQNN